MEWRCAKQINQNQLIGINKDTEALGFRVTNSKWETVTKSNGIETVTKLDIIDSGLPIDFRMNIEPDKVQFFMDEELVSEHTENISKTIFENRPIEIPKLLPPTVQELREKEYLAQGITEKEMIVAVYEDLYEGRPEARIALQAKRMIVKDKIPKG